MASDVKFNDSVVTTSFEPEAVLIACLSSGWATTTCRLLGSKVRK